MSYQPSTSYHSAEAHPLYQSIAASSQQNRRWDPALVSCILSTLSLIGCILSILSWMALASLFVGIQGIDKLSIWLGGVAFALMGIAFSASGSHKVLTIAGLVLSILILYLLVTIMIISIIMLSHRA